VTTSRVLTGLGCATLALVVVYTAPASYVHLDLRLYDSLRRFTRAPQDDGRTTIVAIDEPSLAAWGRWPWPRDVLAQLVERLHDMEASAVALDVLLSEPERAVSFSPDTPGTESGDDRLARVLERASGVTAIAFRFGTAADESSCAPRAMPIAQRQRTGWAPIAELPQASGAICSIPVFDSAAIGSGFINASADADGLLRRTPLLIAYRDGIHPSLALAAAVRAVRAGPMLLEQRADGELEIELAGRRIALDRHGRLLLKYRPGGQTAPIVSAAAILAGHTPAGAVRGRVALVGPTAVGLGDVVATPVDNDLPGIEIHAAAVEGLLSGRFLRRPLFAPLWDVALALAAGGLALWTRRRLGQVRGLVGALAVALAAWIAAGVLLGWSGVYVSPTLTLAGVAAVTGIDTVRAVVRERRLKLSAQRLLVQTLTSLTETRSFETGRHLRRTTELTRLLATAVAARAGFHDNLTPERIALLATLAPLHDIGKVGVSDAVLNKVGGLTDEEWVEMRRHPALGYESLLQAEAHAGVYDDEVIALAKEIVHTHHERWDGSGYPRGLRGDAIPVAGRLIAVVDAYDAIVAGRVYRAGLPHERAVEIIVAERGTHFDPEIVDAFLEVQERFRAAAAANTDSRNVYSGPRPRSTPGRDAGPTGTRS
jgi:adenylate cyclase